MILKNTFGIDLGSSTIKIYDRKLQSVYGERTVAALKRPDRVIALGEEAYPMQEMTPADVSISVPVSKGCISDGVLLDLLLEKMIYEKHRSIGLKPVLYFTVPPDMTEIERRTFASISRRGRLVKSTVALIEKPIADAAAFSCDGSHSGIVLNIGASVTEISLFSKGRIVLSRLLEAAGDRINESIIAAVRRRNRLLIGFKTAEMLKLSLASLAERKGQGLSVSGIDTQTGLPRDGYVTGVTVQNALKDGLSDLLPGLFDFIHRIPPQFLEQVKKDGVFLCGGTSRIPGLSAYFSEKLGLPFLLSPYYENNTVQGLKAILERDEAGLYARYPEKRKNP